jgi:large subunit ribosomal protein L31e
MADDKKDTKNSVEKVGTEKVSPKEDNSKKSVSAVEKAAKLDGADNQKKEKKAPKGLPSDEDNILEREYVINVRKEVLKVPAYKRAKKAVKAIKQFLAKHMKVEDRDLRKVKLDQYLNEEIWQRGIKKPLMRIKVKAKKKAGIVQAELSEIPEFVKFKMAKDAKRGRLPEEGKKKVKELKAAAEEEKEQDKTEEDKKVEKIEAKELADVKEKQQESKSKAQKHTASAKHKEKTMPVRQVMKK